MKDWKQLAHFMYGRGFWYSDPLSEIRSLSEDQLLWVPNPKMLPILWQVGHIASREAMHVGKFIMGKPLDDLIPPPFEVFLDWASVDEIRREIDTVAGALSWVQDTREQVHEWIDELSDDDLERVATAEELDGSLTVAHWLAITTVHTGVHVGRIQMLRALIEGTRDRAC